eukprot:TRINITY_DN27047_c0_g1_i1.p1 TRINITY_DN27047_c0_g1~~TRINITY_DN27047_c0_g1_i1.p1  ORF type:complete len:592 (+),score=92.05 TRINITY_DN27047_c0_g1_i1:85-1860(+)
MRSVLRHVCSDLRCHALLSVLVSVRYASGAVCGDADTPSAATPDSATWCAELGNFMLPNESALCRALADRWTCDGLDMCVAHSATIGAAAECDQHRTCSHCVCSGTDGSYGTKAQQAEKVATSIKAIWSGRVCGDACKMQLGSVCPSPPSAGPSQAPTAAPSRTPSVSPTVDALHGVNSSVFWHRAYRQSGKAVGLAGSTILLSLRNGTTLSTDATEVNLVCSVGVWSTCDCGREQTREVIYSSKDALLGVCATEPTNTSQELQRGCETKSQCDCVMSAWGSWSECKGSCDMSLIQTRARSILQLPTPLGKQCLPQVEYRVCTSVDCTAGALDDWWDLVAVITGACGVCCMLALLVLLYMIRRPKTSTGGAEAALFSGHNQESCPYYRLRPIPDGSLNVGEGAGNGVRVIAVKSPHGGIGFGVVESPDGLLIVDVSPTAAPDLRDKEKFLLTHVDDTPVKDRKTFTSVVNGLTSASAVLTLAPPTMEQMAFLQELDRSAPPSPASAASSRRSRGFTAARQQLRPQQPRAGMHLTALCRAIGIPERQIDKVAGSQLTGDDCSGKDLRRIGLTEMESRLVMAALEGQVQLTEL